MKYNQVAEEIVRIIKAASSFSERGSGIQAALSRCSRDEILDHLDYAGVIPERFDHDSTEEKVFAKYCDALLSRALTELGLRSRVIEERGDAADVHAESDTPAYKIVGDAKAFRLSRTAKNQKDFKVEALNQWRHGADYALLAGPIYQYPNTNSQIYQQAIRYNVTLLSYTHLAFMIRSKVGKRNDLSELWKVGTTLKANPSALAYWAIIRDVMLKITGKTNVEWEKAVQMGRERLREEAAEQIKFWEEEKKRIATLDKNTAIKMLIKALKIDPKISVIRRSGGLS
jgi:hypothetical protein